MVKIPVVSEPCMSIAFDLVGPLPKGKGGKKYLLTYIDLATRWPDAIPLCSITPKQVALGMLDNISGTGIPLEMLTDQGSQFEGRLKRTLYISWYTKASNNSLPPNKWAFRKISWYFGSNVNQSKE